MPRKMAKKYNHQQSFFNKTTFFPLLCSGSSISIKEVKFTDHSSSSSSSSATNIPSSSPKVGCIGQFRRNNKIIGFSSTPPPMLTAASATKTTAVNTHSQWKYNIMLRRWISGRNVGVNIASSCTVVAAAAGYGGGGGSSGSGCAIRCSKVNHFTDGNVSVDVDDLEPPMPVVIKNVPQLPEENLWKRRCGAGVALKSLEPISR